MIRFLCFLYGTLALGTLNAFAEDPVSIPIVDALKETCGRTALKGDPLTIFGGELAGEGEFPWIASFQGTLPDGSNAHYCGGSILSDRWILSAAHCFADYVNGSWNIKDANVVVGTNKNDDNSGHRYYVEKIIIHEKYNHPANPYDIALVRTKEKINFQKTDTDYKVNSVCLPPYKSDSVSYPPKTAVMAGWGNFKTGTASSKLLKVKVPFVEHQECINFYGSNVSEETICYGKGGEGSCKGDSGGPLQVIVGAQSHLIGVVSFGGEHCIVNNPPSALTEVSKYREWIRDHIH